MVGNGKEMSDGGVQFFEGVEKLLEIWFTTADGNVKGPDLRKIPRSKLESLLKIVRCEIISFVKNDQIDAYVLSESSMFISKKRFILKTCGTTTPLLCLQPLLLLAEQYAGFTEVEDLFYSRKNYKRPELQVAPHQHFDQEITLLDTVFPDGAAYCLGAVNRDCWYLYTLNPLPQAGRMPNVSDCEEPDQTLEILMTDLDPEIMTIFTKEECLNATEATKKSGIDKIIPNMIIDDFLFEPCGYSMNGVTKNGYYMTIHITPEPDFSYVSFETNIPSSSYKEIIGKVLDTFNPGKFTVTIFTNQIVFALLGLAASASCSVIGIGAPGLGLGLGVPGLGLGAPGLGLGLGGLGHGLINPLALSPVGPSGIVTGAGAAGPSGVVNGAGAAGPSGIVTGAGAVGPTGPNGQGIALAGLGLGHGLGLGLGLGALHG